MLIGYFNGEIMLSLATVRASMKESRVNICCPGFCADAPNVTKFAIVCVAAAKSIQRGVVFCDCGGVSQTLTNMNCECGGLGLLCVCGILRLNLTAII